MPSFLSLLPTPPRKGFLVKWYIITFPLESPWDHHREWIERAKTEHGSPREGFSSGFKKRRWCPKN